ncbi:MAG: large repetitive protein [Gaiellaceae bacterium]|jgi:hypothetical protein|nr:large repetitive protein [Gaiellaceae bacterium]
MPSARLTVKKRAAAASSHPVRVALAVVAAALVTLALPTSVLAAGPHIVLGAGVAASQSAPPANSSFPPSPYPGIWHDGLGIDVGTINCFIAGGEKLGDAHVGWLAPTGGLNTNSVYYVHVWWTVIGNPCSASARVAPEIFLPAGTTLAISSANPVKCWYGNIGAIGAPWTWLQLFGGCPQAPVLGVRNGLGFYVPGQSPTWPTATGKAVELQIPVVSTQKLNGLLNSTGYPPSLCNDCLTGAVWFMDGEFSPWAFPQTAVLVNGPATPLITYKPTTGITGTAATGTATVNSAGTTGTVYVEDGMTPPGGSTCVQTSTNAVPLSPAGTYDFAINFTLLTPGTTYYWRVCYITGGVTYWGNTQSFSTTGAAKPTIFAVTPGIALPQDHVTITGTHLAGATIVAIVNSTSTFTASFTHGSDPDRSLIFTVPGGLPGQGLTSYTGRVTVTSPGGVVATPTDFFVGIETYLDTTSVFDQETSGQQDDVRIDFHTSEPFAGAECILDNGPLAQSCNADSINYYDLSPGVHQVSIRAKKSGYFDFTPAIATFTVVNADTTPPDTTILSGPNNVSLSSTSATFTFSSSEANSTFQCRYENSLAWYTCATPRVLTGLAQGHHIFAVRAKDHANNVDPTPEYRGWTVDTIPPDTLIASGPANGSATKYTTVWFTYFVVNGNGARCKLDAGVFGPCPLSNGTVIYNGLAAGPHTFTVRAWDWAGNVDPTPSSRTWTVDFTAPTVVKPSANVALRQLDPSGVPVRIYWAGSDPGGSGIASYALRENIDAGGWNPVDIPSPAATALYSLVEPDVSTHAFDVQATDRAGNLSARAAGTAFTAGLFEDDNRVTTRFFGRWAVATDADASGGTLRYADVPAYARFAVPVGTTSVGWASTTGPDRGIATVWQDGVQVATVDLYDADETHRQVVFTRLVTPAIAHTLEIRVTGTMNAEARDARVDVDAFPLILQ